MQEVLGKKCGTTRNRRRLVRNSHARIRGDKLRTAAVTRQILDPGFVVGLVGGVNGRANWLPIEDLLMALESVVLRLSWFGLLRVLPMEK